MCCGLGGHCVLNWRLEGGCRSCDNTQGVGTRIETIREDAKNKSREVGVAQNCTAFGQYYPYPIHNLIPSL